MPTWRNQIGRDFVVSCSMLMISHTVEVGHHDTDSERTLDITPSFIRYCTGARVHGWNECGCQETEEVLALLMSIANETRLGQLQMRVYCAMFGVVWNKRSDVAIFAFPAPSSPDTSRTFETRHCL